MYIVSDESLVLLSEAAVAAAIAVANDIPENSCTHTMSGLNCEQTNATLYSGEIHVERRSLIL
jgi:hypothetical protein